MYTYINIQFEKSCKYHNYCNNSYITQLLNYEFMMISLNKLEMSICGSQHEANASS